MQRGGVRASVTRAGRRGRCSELGRRWGLSVDGARSSGAHGSDDGGSYEIQRRRGSSGGIRSATCGIRQREGSGGAGMLYFRRARGRAEQRPSNYGAQNSDASGSWGRIRRRDSIGDAQDPAAGGLGRQGDALFRAHAKQSKAEEHGAGAAAAVMWVKP